MKYVSAILSSVACPAVQYFYTLSHELHDFRKKKNLLNTKCVLIFSDNCCLKHVPFKFN